MLLGAGAEEYALTLGIIAAFVGTIFFGIKSRHEILKQLKSAGIKKWHILAAIIVLALFIGVEALVVKPTQQLFFDDAIYQGGAQDLLRMGQAWMCNYGTPNTCYLGQVFHEPIGTAFNLAMGFALFGITLGTAFNTMFVISSLAVLMIFFVALLLFRNPIPALFSELLMALSPVMLVWARLTTSDMPSLTYSLIAIFAMIIFAREKKVRTFAFFAFAAALLTYMKVDNIIFVLLLPVLYLLLDKVGSESVAKSVSRNVRLFLGNIFNVRFLLVLLAVLLIIGIEGGYVVQQYISPDNFGYSGAYVQDSCSTNPNPPFLRADSTFGIKYFDYNICSNVYFWFDKYKSIGGYPIMQPALFTILAIIGIAGAAFWERRVFYAIGGWLATIFLLLTFFYAGSFTYGVDWRFVLGMIAQVNIFGGYGAYMIVESYKLFRFRSSANIENRATANRKTKRPNSTGRENEREKDKQ
ncbi:MAG: glycosyltransferase family 39 protein [Candidatus Micrarchaeia archaeon]